MFRAFLVQSVLVGFVKEFHLKQPEILSSYTLDLRTFSLFQVANTAAPSEPSQLFISLSVVGEELQLCLEEGCFGWNKSVQCVFVAAKDAIQAQ